MITSNNSIHSRTSSLFEIATLARVIIAFMPAMNYYMPVSITVLTFVILYYYILKSSDGVHAFCSYLPIFIFDILNILFLIHYGFNYTMWEQLYAIGRPLLWALVAWYIISMDSVDTARRVLQTIIAVYIITAMTTMYGCIIFPNAARLMASGMTDEQDIFSQFQRYNIGGFSFVYTLTLLVPLIVHYYKNISHNKLKLILFLGIILGVIVITEYTTALIGFLIGIIPLFMKKTVSFRKILALFLCLFMMILIFRPLFSSLISHLACYFSSEQISSRLNEISLSLAGRLNGTGNTDLEDRMSRWRESWIIFKSSPIIGSPAPNGGHSFILDSFARYGIVGILSLFILARQLVIKYIKPYKQNGVYTYLCMVALLQIIYAIVNPKLYIEVFVLIIPLYTYTYCHYESSMDNKYTIA